MQATERAIAEQFPGDEWTEVRRVIREKAEQGVSPLRIGFDGPLYAAIRDRLKPIRDAMEADGLFPARLFTMAELGVIQLHQEKLAELASARGVADDEPASPELPPEITVARLRERAFPTLRHRLMDAWLKMGGRIDGRGCWVTPSKPAAKRRRKQRRVA